MKQKSRIEQELNEKEFESDIEKNLRVQELEREQREKLDKDYHPLALMAINLFGNLMIGYILFWIVKWFLGSSLGVISQDIREGIFLLVHVGIWGMAIAGVITKKSPWERFLR